MMTIQPYSTMLCIIHVRGGIAMACSQTLMDSIIHYLNILITTALSGLARLVMILFKKQQVPQTIRDWNDLPESLISSSELSDDSVSKFTSLVRPRD